MSADLTAAAWLLVAIAAVALGALVVELFRTPPIAVSERRKGSCDVTEGPSALPPARGPRRRAGRVPPRPARAPSSP